MEPITEELSIFLVIIFNMAKDAKYTAASGANDLIVRI